MWLQKGADFLIRCVRPSVSILKYIALWTLAAMMLLTFADVLLRYLFNSPIPGAAELIQFMMGIVVTFCVVYTAHKKSHVSVDLVVEHFPKKLKRIIGCACNLLTFAFFVLIAWQAFVYVVDEFHTDLTSPVLYIPVYPFIAISAVGFVALCLVLLENFLRDISEVVTEWTH